MALKVKRAGADEYGTRIKVLLGGEPGAGKTRLSSTFPDVIYANANAGLMSVVDRQPPFVDINSIEDLTMLRLALAQEAKAREAILKVPVQTVIIDTLDDIQRLLVAERLEAQKKEAMAISDWGWLGDQMRAIIRSFRNLPLHVIFTVHLKTVEDAETGQTFVKPQLQGAMQDEVAAYVDVAGLLKASPVTRIVEGESRRMLVRVLQTSPDLRHPWLKDRSGKLPMELEVDLNRDYSRIFKLMFPIGGVAAPSEVAAEVDSSTSAPEPAKAAAKRPAQTAPSSQAAPVAPPEPAPPVEESSQPAEQLPGPLEQLPDSVQSELNGNADAASSSLGEPAAENGAAATNGSTNGSGVGLLCQECGDPVESEDQRDLSMIRFRKVLDRKCFVAAKTAKR